MPLVDAGAFLIRAEQGDQNHDPSTPRSNLECYGLPYGVFGFVSHVLTYYTLFCLWHGRKPMWPFRPLKHGKIDFLMGSAGLIGTIISTSITLVKCRREWEPLVLAIWSLGMSLLNAFTNLHVVYLCWKGEKMHDGRPYDTHQSAFWVALYIPGLVAGIAGLTSLVRKHASTYPGLRTPTIVFWVAVCSTTVLGFGMMMTICLMREQRVNLGMNPTMILRMDPKQRPLRGRTFMSKGFYYTITLFVVLGMLYSDWALAIIMDNTMGVPSNEATKPVAWTYWIAKRVPMFSW